MKVFNHLVQLFHDSCQRPRAMNGVISGRDVVIVVASVLIGGGVTNDEGLVDGTSVKGAITGGVDMTV
ncbi:hypothetical protein Tco_0521411, partial [Tanacetum coccineum]